MVELNEKQKAEMVSKVPKVMIKYSDHFCESIPWQCDYGTDIYEVKVCSSKDTDFYVFAKRSTFLTEVRHGDKNTGMSPKPDPERVGKTTITFYVKNKKNGIRICYRDCAVTGDLGAINFLQKEPDIDEDAFIVGDTCEDSIYVDDALPLDALLGTLLAADDDDLSLENINYGKDTVTIKEVIGSHINIDEFIDTYVHEPMLNEILKSKFQKGTWTQPIHTEPQIYYNQEHCVIQGEESPGCPQDEWYQLFLHQKQYNRMGISHLRISLSEHLGTWFLPVQKQTWFYKANTYRETRTQADINTQARATTKDNR